MTSAAGAAPPGTNPWAVSALAHEHLVALASRYDDLAQQLDGLASRCGEPTLTGTGWTGPGSRAFRARLERHESDIRENVERCRDVARGIRWGAAVLAEQIAAVESVLELGGPVIAVVSAVLGLGLSGATAPSLPAATALGRGAGSAGWAP